MRCSNKVRPIPSSKASHYQNESSCKFLKISTGEYKYNINFVHNNDFAITLFPRKGVGISREWSRNPKKSFWKSGIIFFLLKTNQVFKIFEVQQVTNSHRLKQNKKQKKRKEEKECIGRESNPGLPRGRREFYHWTTSALHDQIVDKLYFNDVEIYSNWQNKSGFWFTLTVDCSNLD